MKAYKEGLYHYLDGCGDEQRVILHIGGHWYLAGWEVPMDLSDDPETKSFGTIREKDIWGSNRPASLI